MNARKNNLQLTVESRQIKDAICVAFHTILLNRTQGKYNYTSETNYKLGSIGFEESDCDQIDFTYIRVNSPTLVADVNLKISEFTDTLNKIINDGFLISGSSQFSPPSYETQTYGIYGIEKWENLLISSVKLEFYQKRRRQWPIPDDQIPWEVWELNLDIVRTSHIEDYNRMREFVGEKLSDMVLTICELINKPQYLPKIPGKSEITSVYDDRFCDCEPYLWRIEADQGHLRRGESFMKKLIKDTLIFTTG